MTVMSSAGRAGVVLPDNVLFEAGSAGEGIRRRLLEQFDFHPLLHPPPASSTQAGLKGKRAVLRQAAPHADGKPNTQALWIYDFRTTCTSR